MVSHSSILAWGILMDRGAWQAGFMESWRVGHDCMTKCNTACIYKGSSIVPTENNAMPCYQNHYLKTEFYYIKI